MKALAAILLSLCLAACGLAQPAVERQSFLVTAERPGGSVRTAAAATLRLGRVEVAPPFDRLGFVYKRSAALFETDFYNQYAAYPGQLLAEAAAAWLRASGLFSAVAPPRSGAFADYRLEAVVEAIYVDFTAADPAAVLAVRWRLLRESDGETVLEHAEESRQPLPERSPRGSAAAFGACFGAVLGGLEAALAARLS